MNEKKNFAFLSQNAPFVTDRLIGLIFRKLGDVLALIGLAKNDDVTV